MQQWRGNNAQCGYGPMYMGLIQIKGLTALPYLFLKFLLSNGKTSKSEKLCKNMKNSDIYINVDDVPLVA